jgi:hypothetical protein
LIVQNKYSEPRDVLLPAIYTNRQRPEGNRPGVIFDRQRILKAPCLNSDLRSGTLLYQKVNGDLLVWRMRTIRISFGMILYEMR